MQRYFHSHDWPLLVLALIKIVLGFHIGFTDNFFRDEYYYIACSYRLDWGYVDHPPFIAFMAYISRILLGESVFAYRYFPALVGGFLVFFSGRLTRELGGTRFAQILTALAVLISPVYLATHSFLSMNVFDHFFWLLGIYALVRLVKTQNPYYWIAFGLIAGFGLLNKISILFLGFGITVGLLCTSQRRWFFTPWPWFAAGISFTIFLPHLIWQIAYGFPTLEFIENATRYKNVSLAPWEFFVEQILELHPFLLPVSVIGLLWFFLAKVGRPFCFLGIAYLVIEAVLITKSGKTYYLAPANFIVVSAGSVWIGSWINMKDWRWLKGIIILVLAVGGILTAPMAMPLLPVQTYPSYFDSLGIKPAASEKSEIGVLPQHLADRFGWVELGRSVLNVYRTLSPEEQSECIILTNNYGQAGAIEFYTRPYDLPQVLSGHNNYYLWGPGEKEGNVAIVVGWNKEDILQAFEQVEEAALVDHPYAMPFERNKTIYICRKPLGSFQEFWLELKNFI